MSCENPPQDAEDKMPRRRKYDKSKICVKCKQRPGNLVMRHAVYCKDCFVPLVTFRFRRALEPHINVKPDGPRRTALRPSGNLLVAYSGGLGSTVLLDLVNRCYVNTDDSLFTTGGGDGGRDHPRHERVWKRVTVCYVEICDALPGLQDRTEDVRQAVARCPGMDFLPLRLQDAFDPAWWAKASKSAPVSTVLTELHNDYLPFSSTLRNDDPHDATSTLRHYLETLPTPSALSSAIKSLIRVLLQHAAVLSGSSHLLYGTTLTSLAVSLISGVAHGGGFHVKEEGQEEWFPDDSLLDEEDPNSKHRHSVRLIRPLREIGRKECGVWTWWMHLPVIGKQDVRWPNAKPGIEDLTKDFIFGLEQDYPSTVSTIVRTCAKLVPKGETAGSCVLCHRPVQDGVQHWKDRIAIRSRTVSIGSDPVDSMSLALHLCYVCHTNLTSKGTRPAPPLYSHPPDSGPTPLPFWTSIDLGVAQATDGGHNIGEAVVVGKQMTEESMRDAIKDFLLDDAP